MRILGIIPARGGSKGIPGKNIKLLNGKPLIYYTYKASKTSNLLSRTIVSTDDDSIISVCNNIGMDVPFKRPTQLAQDNTPSLPVILHALEVLEKEGETYDSVCLLQPTTPFRSPGLIDKAISKFYETGADSLVSVRAVPHEYNPHWVFEPNSSGFLRIATGEKRIIPRRQELPPAFIRDGAIYITKTEVLKSQNSLLGSTIAYHIHNPEHYVNLDTMKDWQQAEKLICAE